MRIRNEKKKPRIEHVKNRKNRKYIEMNSRNALWWFRCSSCCVCKTSFVRVIPYQKYDKVSIPFAKSREKNSKQQQNNASDTHKKYCIKGSVWITKFIALVCVTLWALGRRENKNPASNHVCSVTSFHSQIYGVRAYSFFLSFYFAPFRTVFIYTSWCHPFTN